MSLPTLTSTDRQAQWILLDNLRRKLAIKKELKRQLLKSVARNTSVPLLYRYDAVRQLTSTPKWESSVRIRNRCVVSGRNYNVLRRTQYSRFVFRHNAYFGCLPGIRRSSW